jgi:hypothetical protein
MTDDLNSPELRPGDDGDDPSATGQPSTRRWLLGICLTVVLNLAVTVAAFGGLWLEGRSVDLERDKAVTDQVTSAYELISSDDFNAQAAGFRALERVAEDSPRDRDRIVDLAEAFIANARPVAGKVEGYTAGRWTYVPNGGTQAAVDVIRSREHAEDPDGPGTREFNLPGMVVEAVRFDGVVMRKTRGQACTARWSVWDEADLTGSDFWECGFKRARFVGAELNGVQFEGSDLEGAVFTDADLTGADLERVMIDEGTEFRGADLSRATFAGTDLAGVDFAGVKSVAGADFSQVRGIEAARSLLNAPGAESAVWPPGVA